MNNVKNKLLPMLCLALCLCIVWGSTTTAHAIDDNENIYCNAQLEVGETFILRRDAEYSGNGHKTSAIITGTVTENNKYMCFYLKDDVTGNASSGYQLGGDYDVPSATITHTFSNANWNYVSDNVASTNDDCFPNIYHKVASDFLSENFYTNIPIFETQADALAYRNGELTINDAINYNKNLENGSWVSPFEDIEINDNEVDLPKVSNLSHQGFTLTNNPSEKGYLIELYVENGLRDPINFENNSLGKPLLNPVQGFSHTYGLLDPIGDAYNYQTVFDLVSDYGIDNVGNLTQTCRNFYTAYPSANSYDRLLQSNKNTWAIWGQPFGKNFVFWNSNSSISVNDISSVTCNTCPLAFTTYKIRYFYYDDASGWHYGPWSVYTYFANGEIAYSSVYQDDEDKILETDTTYGEQDNSGNIVVNTSGFNASQFVDLNNPNELFGYIRSVTNNVTATMGNFSMLFATVFTFIPTDIQYMIWLGIAVMVIIGVIKVIKG